MSAKKSVQPDIWLTKAYKNPEFLNSPAARSIRVLSEMIEPADRIRRHGIQNTVVFFGSARTLPLKTAKDQLKSLQKEAGTKTRLSPKLKAKIKQAEHFITVSEYYEAAADLAEKLTRWFNEPKQLRKKFVICSGGGPGIMEAANRGASKVNGLSMGLNISLPMEQDPNPFQTRDISFEFHYFFIRKFWFFYLAKALCVFPGGFGTFDELFEILTLIQTRKTKKFMPVVLFGKDFWSKAVNFEMLVEWGHIDRRDLDLFQIHDDVDEAFQYITGQLTQHYIR